MAKTNFEIDRDNLEVRIDRTFEATPQRLWQAYSQADQIEQWWENTKIDKHDFRVGGQWRFVSGDKGEHAFRGEYKEIDEPNKIVRTFEYEPVPGHIMTESVKFTPVDNGSKTHVLISSKYSNLDDLNGMTSMGMEDGAVAGLERVAKLVEQA